MIFSKLGYSCKSGIILKVLLIHTQWSKDSQKSYRAIPRPTCDGRFYQPETRGRYLGESVPMAVSRGSIDRPETISISWITSVGIAPAKIDDGKVAKVGKKVILRSGGNSMSHPCQLFLLT